MNEYEKQIFREYEEENRQHFEENRSKKLIRRKNENNSNIRPRGQSNDNS